MILIADSGSTKTHWCLMAANGQKSEFFMDGINPFYQTSDAIKNSISMQLLPQLSHLLWAGTITDVYFYGAGCTPEKKKFVATAISACFKKAEVHVESDMVGAARGLLGRSEGIACILGTGSNSCLYDGTDIVKNVPALGFILGDEGSGAVLGKRLVADLLKNQMTDELKEKFLTQYGVTQADIIENVYRKPFPNRYLASLSKFAAENIENPLIYNLVYDHFNQFVVRNLKQYPAVPVGFIGSIAYYYKEVLSKVIADNGLQLAQILQSPMSGLIEYHAQDVRPTME
ncbi:MAG: ATPase [Paludibacter sp.]|nr:ATPase [Bacteroidales bacterium]MCM1069714.1 ATPase [Prevotella sp.]MCM1354378.1 ATPase [Bacteroides sp.]MCM1441925.1 ATPase [Muribaculum sp.]MCM1482576.1 ATPase [Paludibacter sp.]